MSTDTPQADTTTANITTNHKGSTRVGWDVETLVWGSRYALVVGGVVLAIIAALGLRWEDQADERREIREEEYKRTAGKEIEAAKADASRANESTAKLVKETEALRLQVAKQQERAAKAEARVLELEAKNIPRTISDDVFKRLVEALQISSEKGEVLVEWVDNNPEARTYGYRFVAALSKAGWKTTTTGAVIGVAETGVLILVKNPAAPPAHSVALRNILASVGIKTGVAMDPNRSDGTVQLLIATKP